MCVWMCMWVCACVCKGGGKLRRGGGRGQRVILVTYKELAD